MESLAVTPVYGYGWFEKNGRMIDTPAPFILRIDQIHGQIGEAGSRIAGVILGDSHKYAGKCAALEIRTVGPQPHYNVVIYERPAEPTPNKVIVTGYAHLS